jgi:hypothetical protein
VVSLPTDKKGYLMQNPTLFVSYLGFSPSPVDLVSPVAFSSFDIYALCLV